VSDAEDTGGYAKALSADTARRQQEMLGEKTKDFDVVVTTALVPGRPAPRLVTAETVAGMRLGLVIIVLASEAGGNCELTEPDQVVVARRDHPRTDQPALHDPGPCEPALRAERDRAAPRAREGRRGVDRPHRRGGPRSCVTHAGEVVNDAVKAALGATVTA
jgi:hypothetical protein